MASPTSDYIGLALMTCLVATGCNKVEKLEQAVVDRAASKVAAKAEKALAAEKQAEAARVAAKAAEKAKFDEAVASAVDKAVAKREAEQRAAAASAAKDQAAGAASTKTSDVAEGADAGPTTSHDAEALAMLATVRDCKRVNRRRCKPFAELEKRCKAAWKARATAGPTYDLLWRTLLHVTTTSKDERERYAAAYLSTFRCRPTAATLADEVIGRALLDATRGEPKDSKAGPRMAELLSGWWAAELPKLHTDMGRLLTETAHPAPSTRAEFARLSARHAKKRKLVAELLIAVAAASTDHVDVRTQAIRALPQLVGTESADEALSVLAQIALEAPNPLTIEAYGALGDAASLTHWPALLDHWRKNRGQPIIGAAMARATWRYAVAKYGNETKSLPIRVAAFDTAVEVLAEPRTPAKHRAVAIFGIQRGGHPNARPVLERIAASDDQVLAAAATKALQRVKTADPAFAALVEPLPREKVARPGRPASNNARPAANNARPPKRGGRAAAPTTRVKRPGAGRPGR